MRPDWEMWHNKAFKFILTVNNNNNDNIKPTVCTEDAVIRQKLTHFPLN